MAFWDKLNSVAKSIGDVANDTIESTKLTVKIRSEKNLLESEWKKIGEYYYNKYREGETLDEGVADFVRSADECRRRVEKLEKMVRDLEAARVKREAAKNWEEEYVDAEFVEHPEEETVVCPSCGEENGAHMKYCVHCGAKLEIQVEQSDAETLSESPEGTGADARNSSENAGETGVDTEAESGNAEEAGTDTEAASKSAKENADETEKTGKRFCHKCGKELGAEAKFCPECGTKAE
ncbi:MAG TPA: zinc ribbon domain-containing protein [Candidatus Limivivens intestinipullorum]|uniref:Zinc ribbon domain-containing protein n=1 Tax=Candidatus Limivivens intestinipullorum TaxID=2840858 RepID=A0A9D1EVM1_9FIRM|nr:zinc ribbon domain-containing protein [Candidatus Limivivens intestinipullorum]